MEILFAVIMVIMVEMIKADLAKISIAKVIVELIAGILAIITATIIIANILAIPMCFIRKVYESFRTPEQRAAAREANRKAKEIAKRIEMEKLEREREARRQMEAYLSVIYTALPISMRTEEIKVPKKVEEIDEDFGVVKCVWKENIKIIKFYCELGIGIGKVIVVIIGIIILGYILINILPIISGWIINLITLIYKIILNLITKL